MSRIEPIGRPPDNFASFVEEVATGLSGLYGPAAAQDYRRKAPSAIVSSLSHPLVSAWMAVADTAGTTPRTAQAMLMSARRDNVGHITFLHVLKSFARLGLEAELARTAVAEFRAAGVLGISAEPVALCELKLDDAFAPLGFTRIERQLMSAPLHSKSLSSVSASLPDSVSADVRDYDTIADIIADAYRDDPGRELHAEVRTINGAKSFVRTAADGAYGAVRPSFLRVIRHMGEPAGAIVGCEAAPGVGFVLQVVVRPGARGRGIGTRLMLELAHSFRDAGLHRVALGVTNTNPARGLYERLGFRKIHPVNAYVWWR